MHYITKPPCDPKIMTFGAFHTDHMLEIDWTDKMGYDCVRVYQVGPVPKSFRSRVFPFTHLLPVCITQSNVLREQRFEFFI